MGQGWSPTPKNQGERRLNLPPTATSRASGLTFLSPPHKAYGRSLVDFKKKKKKKLIRPPEVASGWDKQKMALPDVDGSVQDGTTLNRAECSRRAALLVVQVGR